MRVALVIQKTVGLRGGAERVVADLARALVERGHAVSIVTYEPATGRPGYDVGGATLVDLFPGWLRLGLRSLARGARVDAAEHSASTRGNSPRLARAKWHATHGLFARRLAHWLRAHPHDAVVGFLPPAISAASIAGRRLGADRPRIVASTHNLPSEDFGDSPRWDQNPVARRTNLWALEAADVVTVLQPEFVDQLPPGARAHAVVMPNAVERLSTPTGLVREPLVVGVGRLTDVKRYDLAIEAFARIAPDLPDWTLAVYGDGPERRRLVAQAARTGAGERIHVAGATDRIADVYDRARILVHPARFEGFGLSVAEAILHGVLVLAFRECAGVDRLVEDGATGLLVEAGDDPAGALAAGLRRLIAAPPADDGRRAAAEQLAARLAPRHVYDDWERLLATR